MSEAYQSTARSRIILVINLFQINITTLTKFINDDHGKSNVLNAQCFYFSLFFVCCCFFHQVQEEIESLKVKVRQSKPQIKGLLAQITQLTQQATG